MVILSLDSREPTRGLPQQRRTVQLRSCFSWSGTATSADKSYSSLSVIQSTYGIVLAALCLCGFVLFALLLSAHIRPLLGLYLLFFFGTGLMFLASKTILESPRHVKHQGHGVTGQCLGASLLNTTCLQWVFSGTSDQASTVHFPLGWYVNPSPTLWGQFQLCCQLEVKQSAILRCQWPLTDCTADTGKHFPRQRC